MTYKIPQQDSTDSESKIPFPDTFKFPIFRESDQVICTGLYSWYFSFKHNKKAMLRRKPYQYTPPELEADHLLPAQLPLPIQLRSRWLLSRFHVVPIPGEEAAFVRTNAHSMA